MLKVTVDASEKSKELVRLLTERKVKFETVYGIPDPPRWPLPAIEGSLGSVYGFENIYRYFFASDEELDF
jgi:hypothetical protein